ncbi:MAG: Gfo/Idh/MocA family oxidoreductase [Burkholderiaceae bacterium]
MSRLIEPIVGRPIRLALAGCGRIAASHFAAIEQHRGDVSLVAVCDTDPAALAAAVKRTKAKGHADLGAMLRAGGIDAVVLCTPSGLHAAQAIECAAAGLHVVTEKPMATRWQDGLDMVRACDAAAVRLFVVKQNRRNATLQLLKRAVTAGRFGRIYAVAVNVFWTRPQSYYDSAAWRGTWEFDGGAFMNQASHYVDLLDWIVGPVESVMAYTGTLARDIEVEDTGVAALRWRSGAMGTLNVTMLTHPKNLEGSITVLGEKGTARIGGVAVNRIEQWEFAAPHAMDSEVAGASYEVSSVYGHGHALYYDNVIETLRGHAQADTDGREGLRALELLIAMYLSARDGRRVSLPLQL